MVFNYLTRASEQKFMYTYPRPVPPPNESKGLMQNFDVKVDKQGDKGNNKEQM